MTVGSLLAGVRKSWWIILGCVVIGAVLGGIATWRTAPVYQSSVTFFVRTPTDQIGGAYQGDQFAQKRVNSYVQLAESQRLAKLVLADTQLSLSPDELQSMVSAKGDPNTVLLTVAVQDTDPGLALDVARSISTQFVELVSQLETPPGAQAPSVSLDVTSDATLDPDPIAPRPLVNVTLGALLGLVIGCAVAWLRQALDTTVRSAEALKSLLPTSILGVVPFDAQAKSSPLIVHEHAKSLRAEAMRQLRTNLEFADVDNPVRVIAVTSSVPSEGKSTTAANLSIVCAEAGKRVLLIEGDLRRPRVAQYLGLEGAVGLANVLAGQVSIDEVLQPWGAGGLTVLPSGSIAPNPSELLASRSMSDLLAEMRKAFDIIIIDTPPLVPVTDGAIISARADGVVLIVRQGSTTRHQVHIAAASLQRVGARLLGCVLNRVPLRGAEAYDYGDYYSPLPADDPGSSAHRSSPEALVARSREGGSQEAGLVESKEIPVGRPSATSVAGSLD